MVKLLRSHHKTIQSSIQSLTSHSQSLLKNCNLFRVGVADKNVPVTPFSWHDQIKESNCQVIFSNWDCPALASNQNWSVTEVTHQRGLEYCVIIMIDTWLVAVVVAAAVLVIVVVVVSVIVEVEGATVAVVVV
jgi:hypothetical protein